MIRHLIHALKKNITLKIFSLIIGSSLWVMLSSLYTATIWIDIPLSFYNQHDTITLNGPETISVQLSGNRQHLRTLNKDMLAIHLDAQALHEGKNHIIINKNNLFLPESICVVNYSPSNSYIEKISY